MRKLDPNLRLVAWSVYRWHVEHDTLLGAPLLAAISEINDRVQPELAALLRDRFGVSKTGVSIDEWIAVVDGFIDPPKPKLVCAQCREPCTVRDETGRCEQCVALDDGRNHR